MNPKVITPPTITDVVSDVTLRVHLKIAADGSEDENMALDRLAAHKAAQQYTRTAIGVQTFELALDAFPLGAIPLPGGKVASIGSVTYVDVNGTTQTLATSVYELDEYSTPCCVALKFEQVWPATRVIQNAVKVQYVAGEVADAVKSAIMLMCGHLRMHRGDEADSHNIQPQAAKALLDTERLETYA